MIADEHTFATGDCVKIICGMYTGCYAFKKCFKKWILNPNDLDSRPRNEF